MRQLFFLFKLITFSFLASAQPKPRVYPLADTVSLHPVNVVISAVAYQDRKAVRVLDTAKGITGERKYARLTGLSFHNGTITVDLAGRPSAGAAESARGFVGIAFRINEADSSFECIYLRPTNGRAEDQVRRNHSVQYISFPNYPWQKLRRDFPEKYESYVDLEVGKWTKVRIVVKDSTAKLYVHEASQPTLVISDLKLGSNAKGSVGLWIGSGTEAYFRNLFVKADD